MAVAVIVPRLAIRFSIFWCAAAVGWGVPAAGNQSADIKPLYLKLCVNDDGRMRVEELQELLAETSLADARIRRGLLAAMQNPLNRCTRSLQSWLAEIALKPSDTRANTGRLTAVTLGVLLNLSAARDLIENEAASGGGLEWLATLKQWDEPAYRLLLRQWVLQGAESVRRARNLSRLTKESYGKTPIGELPKGVVVNAVAPVVLDLFLKERSIVRYSADELAALNVIFVNLSSGIRKLYSDAYAEILRRFEGSWVEVFRTEPAWVQFHLADLMGRAGGAEMVRELMWLSQNHVDVRMKGRASMILDEMFRKH